MFCNINYKWNLNCWRKYKNQDSGRGSIEPIAVAKPNQDCGRGSIEPIAVAKPNQDFGRQIAFAIWKNFPNSVFQSAYFDKLSWFHF